MVNVIVILVFGIAAAVASLVVRKRHVRGAASLVVFSCALAVWAVAYGLYLDKARPDELVWLGLIYLSATVSTTSLLTFTLAYTNHEEWLTHTSLVVLAIEPLLTQVFFWTNRWHALFFTSRPDTNGTALVPGTWYWINAAYSDGLLILALILLSQTFLHKSRQYLLQSLTVAIGIFIPILVKIFSLVGFGEAIEMERAPLGFAITGLLLCYSIYRFRLLDIMPVARNEVVESMSDGWMVIDPNNRIVDLNPAAEALIGRSRDSVFGQPAELVLENWTKLNQEQSIREQEIKGSINLDGEWRYFGFRILPLTSRTERPIGKVVLWRDMTERRRSDEARQKARDEMFVLLHSIAGAASQTLNLDDFLAESIHHIVYSFQSQASAIFLSNKSVPDSNASRCYLAAHHGVPNNKLDHLASSPAVAAIVAGVLEQKEAFFVLDVCTDPRLPVPMRQSGVKSLLISPLVAGEKALGAVCLIRQTGPPYGPDEITRLGVVAEELAAHIQGNLQRQLAIALEERQRVVRDLHDSVSQKLYGLVALTEAAQASLENGAGGLPSEVLARIGENARQALKEMRLFLFEMKPADVEHEGLVAVLHQRLAAVEGRADIKARLLADDDLNLSLEKELALYYIAQEALNNILKHANASTVMIRIKKKKATVALEVEDNGCGFDLQNAHRMGLGHRIMQERISKVDGKLKIESTPGKGTKIIATVSKANVPSATKNRVKA